MWIFEERWWLLWGGPRLFFDPWRWIKGTLYVFVFPSSTWPRQLSSVSTRLSLLGWCCPKPKPESQSQSPPLKATSRADKDESGGQKPSTPWAAHARLGVGRRRAGHGWVVVSGRFPQLVDDLGNVKTATKRRACCQAILHKPHVSEGGGKGR